MWARPARAPKNDQDRVILAVPARHVAPFPEVSHPAYLEAGVHRPWRTSLVTLWRAYARAGDAQQLKTRSEAREIKPLLRAHKKASKKCLGRASQPSCRWPAPFCTRRRRPKLPRLPRDHLYSAFDGLIVDASPRGPLHDGDQSNERAMWLLDAFEASGKPVAWRWTVCVTRPSSTRRSQELVCATRTSPLCRCESGSGLERGKRDVEQLEHGRRPSSGPWPRRR